MTKKIFELRVAIYEFAGDSTHGDVVKQAKKSERKRAEFGVPPHGGTAANSPMVQPQRGGTWGTIQKTILNPDERRRWQQGFESC